MKLLLVIYSMESGGAERVTSILANYWGAKDWDICIVTLTDCDSDAYPLHSSVRRIGLSLDQESRNLPIAVTMAIKRVLALRKLIKSEQPDVVVGMMTAANCLIALAGMGLNVARIGSERSFPPQVPINRAWSLFRKLAYPRLDAIVAQTSRTADWLMTATRICSAPIIANPVVLPVISRAPKLDPAELLGDRNLHSLLAVGRLSEEKRFDRLICHFADLAERFPDWNLVILGDGPERPALEQQISELGLMQRILLPGSAGNVSDWYNHADLFALTSRFEGFPNTLLEALAHGLPAVSVDCDTGPGDIIRQGVDGFLTPPGDEAAFVRAMAQLMQDSNLRSRLSQRAIETRERFSIERIGGLWEDLFNTAASTRSR